MSEHPVGHSDDASEPPILVTTPSGLVSCVPYLVGFVPAESLVMVLMSRPPRTVVLTLRADLDLAEPHDAHDSLDQLGRAVDRAVGYGVDLDLVHTLVYSPAASRLPEWPTLQRLSEMFRDRGIGVGEVLAVHADRMWFYDCPHLGCCPGEGHPVVAAEALRAEFSLVSAGVGYVSGREALEAAVRPEAGSALSEDSLRAARREHAAAGPEWLRRCEDSLWAAFAGTCDRQVAGSVGAFWAVGLSDSRVREPILFRLLVEDHGQGRCGLLSSARQWLTALVTMLPGAECAAPAATLAAIAWQQGDGASARIAAQRALEADPENRLARLIDAACGSGMPPSQWLEVLSTFTLDELRHCRRRGTVPAA